VTEPARSRVGQALSSYAGMGPEEDPADLRARTRRQIVDQWLPEITDEVLASQEIAPMVTQAGVDPATLRETVFRGRREVLAPADAQLERVVDVLNNRTIETSETAPNRFGGGTVIALAIAFITAPLYLLVSWWGDLAWYWRALGVVVVLFLGFIGVVGFFGGLDDFRGRRRTRPSVDAVLATWRQACRDEGVLPLVRQVLNEYLEPIHRVQLGVSFTNAPGLLDTHESAYQVRTRSVETFLAATRRLPTGAIGLAGPRGVGKTFLINHFAGLTVDDGRRALKVTVSAPVQYEPRDFVLHLFATVCRAVLEERSPKPSKLSIRLLVAGVMAFFALLSVVSAALTGQLHTVTIVGDAVIAAMAALLALPVLVRRMRRRGGDDDTVGLARRHLRNIHYLQTHTSGWSGKLTLPLSSEAGWSRQTQRERRSQTYPELVAALREFLATVARSGSVSPAVIIAVDELDKIESADDAQRFVNEIKGIFGAPGTQFLVSVSEDALASFERRGLPMRDAFDSAFHEVVRVDYLTLADTVTLLSRRVLLLPEPFHWLVHCMSGGLPRDVVRTVRAMVALASPDETPPSLDDVCVTLVADDLARKSHAFQLACRDRDIGDSPEVTDFIRSLRKLRTDAPFLLTLVPSLRTGGDLATLSRQAAAYVYYLATLLEVFRRDTVDSHDKDTFDLLARAKQSLAVHPRLAWLQVDEFRESWGLATVPVD
jgi:energy-coupling factor transporter ATP-binding protein EcfA2